VTDAEYRALPAVNFSTLKYMAKSPLHYKHALENPSPVTDAMSIGTAEHCMVLEPSQFPPRYTVWTGGRRAGKEWDAFCLANEGKTIIKSDEYDRCVAMRDAVRAHPAAGPILASGGESEKVVLWKDPETGLDCKARIDWLCGSVVDLKTTADGDPRRFASLAARYRYHAQLAWYRWGVEVSTGLADWPCQLIVVEATPPHDVAVYNIDELTLGAGLDEARELLRRVAECKASGRWPGRFEGEATLNLPRWAFDDDDAATELGLVIGGN
jgi:hypothetical protein